MILADGVPSSFKYLEGSELIKKEPNGDHDTFITVDCADFKRTGKIFENFGQPDINIDHHKTNEKFGKLNLIEAEEVATAAILTNHLPDWGLKITQPIAAALLTGIITDTLGFRTSNITPEALRQSATLMEAGVNMPDIYMRALVNKSFPAARYWGAGLSSLQSKHGIVWGTLTIADRKSAGYGGNDDADLINMISAIDGNKVGMVFVEQSDNHVKDLMARAGSRRGCVTSSQTLQRRRSCRGRRSRYPGQPERSPKRSSQKDTRNARFIMSIQKPLAQ